MRGLRTLPAIVLLLPSLLLVSCAQTAGGRIFVDGYGRCPLHVGSNSEVCGMSKLGNVEFGGFSTPHKPWGVAYAFNCGRRPAAFYLRIRLPLFDGSYPGTTVVRRAPRGQGWKMETIANQARKTTPNNWGNTESLQLMTTCTFQVRAVLGPASAVRHAVPPIPDPAKTNSGKVLIDRTRI